MESKKWQRFPLVYQPERRGFRSRNVTVHCWVASSLSRRFISKTWSKEGQPLWKWTELLFIAFADLSGGWQWCGRFDGRMRLYCLWSNATSVWGSWRVAPVWLITNVSTRQSNIQSASDFHGFGWLRKCVASVGNVEGCRNYWYRIEKTKNPFEVFVFVFSSIFSGASAPSKAQKLSLNNNC